MPRSGSTLLESILSLNNEVYDLGECEIFEESFLEYKKSNQDLNLAKIYWEKIKIKKNKPIKQLIKIYIITYIQELLLIKYQIQRLFIAIEIL